MKTRRSADEWSEGSGSVELSLGEVVELQQWLSGERSVDRRGMRRGKSSEKLRRGDELGLVIAVEQLCMIIESVALCDMV